MACAAWKTSSVKTTSALTNGLRSAVFIQLAYQEYPSRRRSAWASATPAGPGRRRDGTLPTTRLPARMECVDGKARLIPERGRGQTHLPTGGGRRRAHRPIGARCGGRRCAVRRSRHPRCRFRAAVLREMVEPNVALILNDGRAAGRFQFCRPDGSPELAVIDGFLPAAVTEEEFLGGPDRTDAATRTSSEGHAARRKPLRQQRSRGF